MGMFDKEFKQTPVGKLKLNRRDISHEFAWTLMKSLNKISLSALQYCKQKQRQKKLLNEPASKQ
jgi:hypothetical protein